LEVNISGRKEILEADDDFVVPAEARQDAIYLEEGIFIAPCSPAIEAFLKK